MNYAGRIWNGSAWVLPAPKEVIKKSSSRSNKKRSKGIYSITFENVKAVYIGQSINIESRWSQHRSVLNKNTSENSDLQEHWNKYKDKAVFRIEELIDGNLKQREHEIAQEYVGKGYKLLNDYFLLNATSILIDEEHKPIILKILKLIGKSRLDPGQLDAYLDTL